MPVRKTASSAGYDFVVAEDTIIPSYDDCMLALNTAVLNTTNVVDLLFNHNESKVYTLDEVAALTKETKAKPTLVSTGMKCKLDRGTYLELSVRSSSPLKYWLVLANGVGIIDADYYNNPDNEGEIFFQLINLSPFDIKLQKGETIGQGIIKPYLITEDDAAAGERTGGFGSTGA
jgi:dUTP pyrophosphatase